MPNPFAPLFGFSLGAAMAWIAAPELARAEGPVVASRPFAVVAAFALLVWVPVVGYFVACHGDWSYLYVFPWQHIPSAIDLGLVLISAAAVVGGFLGAVLPVRKRRLGPMLAMVLAPGTIGLIGLSAAARRLAVSGTYAQFHGEFGTEAISASTLGKGVLFMAIVLVLGLLWTVRALLRMAVEAKS